MNKRILSILPAFLLALFLVPVLLSTFQQTDVAHAAVFNVNIFHDENDGSCVGTCSLRDAIAVASSNSEDDVINIPAGTYTLSDTNGTLTVSENITFNGNSATDTFIDAQGNSRVFNVTAGTVSFNDLTIQGGNSASSGGGVNATGAASLAFDSVVITGNMASTNGGGIAIASGSLTLTGTQILSNTAGNSGGGIYSNNGSITFDNSQVLTNTAVASGGGISLNLANATLQMNSGQINDNTANTTSGFPGGGIHVAQGSATIDGGEIRNNQAFRGGGILVSGGVAGGSAVLNGGQIIDNEANYGGGVYVFNTQGTLTINGGDITENRSIANIFGGGGLYIFQGLTTLNDGNISLNTAVNDGGGMEIGDAAGRFVQNGGAIFSNSAGNMGGGIYAGEGTVTISGGTIHTNDSTTGGGGIALDMNGHATISNSAILTNTTVGATLGGGISNAGTLTMTNVTMSGNGAGSGAGISNAGTAVLTNVTLSENTATNNGGGLSNSGGTLTVGSSIIFGNAAPSGADCSGTITSADYNFATASCGLSGGNDSTSNPLLQPLALNGGETFNYGLSVGSPAIDGGNDVTCPATDQRGNLRPVGGVCDSGAYEDGIGFFISDASLTEGDAGSSQMSFIVSRSFMTSTTYTVDYETADGTALAGSDYTAISDTLTFAASAMTQTVNVAILGDTIDEFDETLTVTLSNPSGASQLGDDTATGTILDNDDPPTLTMDDVTVTEGDSGTVTAVFTATLSAISAKTIMVDWATMDGTAVAGADYVADSGTLTFTPGDDEETVSITVNGDTTDEFDETFTVELSNESNVTLTDTSAEATITDDDLPPELSIQDVSVTEGDSGTTIANFVVNLTAASGKTITVDYQTAADSATAGSDFISATDTLTITPGLASDTISITVNGDTVDEINETFNVTLSMPSEATIDDGTAVGTITDDDPLPTATIGNATVTEGDSGTVVAEFTVTLSGASEKVITIDYSSSDGSATAGEDYTAVADTLTFSPGGSLSQTISVIVNGDEDSEASEIFYINLTGSSNASLGNSQATGTISNDDGYLLYLPIVVKP
ncbi:Calx-beta domain-containing protein [Candidatus Leptofilum sp.]|uniref:Calx-beta domain-containing protein n=1 Tax=Candidatus Leptofilum sp. TaxID=3241576 RepID=UPI003B5C22FA